MTVDRGLPELEGITPRWPSRCKQPFKEASWENIPVTLCVCACVCVMTLDGWVVLKPFPTHDTPTGRGPALVTRRPHRAREERNELKGIWMPAFGVTVHAFPSGAGGVNKWTPRSF